ncbi:unnamed protein product, partial [Mesorhabditis spiculigera]
MRIEVFNRLQINHCLLFLTFLLKFALGKLCADGSTQDDCERYRCDSVAGIQHSPLEYSSRAGRSLFSHPCRCLPDWNSLFCNQSTALLNLPPTSHISPPTVCICRKFSDSGSYCHQFITRCFKRGSGKCNCCFNQPDEYCDHVKCSNLQPDFGGSNTTCVCYSNPADYPMQVCGKPHNRIGSKWNAWMDAKEAEAASWLDFDSPSFPTTLSFMLILGSLLLICVLLIFVAVHSQRRRQKQARERRRADQNGNGNGQQPEALETLLPQKRPKTAETQFS